MCRTFFSWFDAHQHRQYTSGYGFSLVEQPSIAVFVTQLAIVLLSSMATRLLSSLKIFRWFTVWNTLVAVATACFMTMMLIAPLYRLRAP
jgi:hypothetical protein